MLWIRVIYFFGKVGVFRRDGLSDGVFRKEVEITKPLTSF